MVCRNRGIYGFLGACWVLITYIICPPANGVDSNQDLIWCAKLGYIWVLGSIVGPDYVRAVRCGADSSPL